MTNEKETVPCTARRCRPEEALMVSNQDEKREFTIQARDSDIGHVKDFYFDDLVRSER